MGSCSINFKYYKLVPVVGTFNAMAYYGRQPPAVEK
jgi:hypothetical protein